MFKGSYSQEEITAFLVVAERKIKAIFCVIAFIGPFPRAKGLLWKYNFVILPTARNLSSRISPSTPKISRSNCVAETGISSGQIACRLGNGNCWLYPCSGDLAGLPVAPYPP